MRAPRPPDRLFCGSAARVVFVGEEAPEIGPEISGDFPQVLAALVERAESSR